MNNLLNKIITQGGNNRFYRFGNADGKRWVVPARNMQVALSLYQPSGIKGKLLKAFFPYLHSLPFVCRAIKAETTNCTLQEELNNLLCEILGVKEIEFAIFKGTPCVHQKITMQLSHGGHILGYCKASDNADILSLFEKETETLSVLAEKGVNNIPRALFCGTLSNGVHIFVQSTVKSHNSKVLHSWGGLHDKFLATLHERTKQTVLFEESDYYQALVALQKNIDRLPAVCDKEATTTAINAVVAKFHDKKVVFSAYHADFTPWNMFAEQGELFVFDFEYSALTYPPGLDAVHFAMQTAIFERHLAKEEIATLLIDRFGKETTAMYLLDIISRFTLREKGDVTGDASLPFVTWDYILRACLCRVDTQ